MSGSEWPQQGWPPLDEPAPIRLDAERAFRLASALLRLGLSRSATEGILGTNDHDLIERQLAYLPYRAARDPAAFLLAAIRGDYSRPPGFPPGRAARLDAARLDAYRQESPALESAPVNPYLTPMHAPTDAEPTLDLSALDEGAEPPAGQADAGALGHGAEGAPGADPLDSGMEPDWAADDPELPNVDGKDR